MNCKTEQDYAWLAIFGLVKPYVLVLGIDSSSAGSRWINAPVPSYSSSPMASSFIPPPLDPNPNSPSSKQRRRNAALSCAECRR